MPSGRKDLVAYARKQGSRTLDRIALHVLAFVRPAAPPVRPIFIVGCPRSGTTLLSALLRRHPDLAGSGSEGQPALGRTPTPVRQGVGLGSICGK